MQLVAILCLCWIVPSWGVPRELIERFLPNCTQGATTRDVVYDFEEFAPGDAVYSMESVKVKAWRFVNGRKEEAVPMAFDSKNPSGGDKDLRSKKRGMILIASTDDNSNDPDDHEEGGVIIFKFPNQHL